MHDANVTERFITSLTGVQQRLYAYILSLVHDLDAARDVLQETNLVLWRRAADYDPARDFLPWAVAHARTQTMAYLRDRGRDRHLFNPKLLDLLADDAAERLDTLDDRRRALHVCLGELADDQRQLIDRRYQRNQTNDVIARAMGRSVTAVAQKLYRIRQTLLRCIESRQAEERA